MAPLSNDDLSNDELREMVRASIARLVGPEASARSAPAATGGLSFARLPLATGGDADGACVIEPAVRCTHCGYCQSYGH